MRKVLYTWPSHGRSHRYYIDKIYNGCLHPLGLLFDLFYPTQDMFTYASYRDETHSYHIWSPDYTKSFGKRFIEDDVERRLTEDKYWDYYDRKYKENPQLNLTFKDYHTLLEEWKEVKKNQPKYIVVTLDDSAEYDVVRLYGCEELSDEDKADLEFEREVYNFWVMARYRFSLDNPPSNTWDEWLDWRDDDFVAYILQYYEFDEHGIKPIPPEAFDEYPFKLF